MSLSPDHQMASALVFNAVAAVGPSTQVDALRRCRASTKSVADLLVDAWHRLAQRHELNPLGDGRWATAVQLRDMGLLDRSVRKPSAADGETNRPTCETLQPASETTAVASAPTPKPVQRTLF